MKVNQFLLILSFEFLFLFFGESRSLSADDGNQVYIVYMGATDSTNGSLRNDHAYVLNTVLTRNKKALVHNYKYGFSGFAARLSKEEANTIAQHPGVVSVFPNPILKLHTTRSWDFLKSQNHIKTDSTFSNSSSSSNVVIGMLDTGIWPEAESFKDNGMGPIPPGWKGTCMTSHDFNTSNCNRKIIGARYYADGKNDGSKTVRDNDGHGTHTASTAAGNVVSGASYYGLATGTAKGGSPESRLAIYKVCTDGCSGATILAAFDDAISDGVDILSLSLGGPEDHKPDLTTNVVAIGAFHAVEHGILVVCAAGNNGPWPRSVTNDAPWILTVGATTIDRNFQSNIVLGNNKVVEGEAINFSPLSKSADYPLITGESAKLPTADSEDDLEDARHCHLEALDREKVNGSIVICDGMNDTNFYYSTSLKVRVLQGMGALGLVHITDKEGAVPDNYGDFPATIVRPKDHATILQYLNSTSNPKATILPTTTVLDYKPAPMVAIFSSRGPSSLTKNIIKPDIAAPGGDILAAWTGTETDETYVPNGKLLSPYNIISGTSMSCPHVSGLAGSIKSKNPTWSPSAIKSAIMTSATQINNLKAPITTDLGPVATPYDYGAGEITTESFQPGLVYETTTMDYLNYMCYLGLNTTKIKVISKTVPKNFSCPKDSTPDYISNINYPSIAIPKFSSQGTVNVNRTVTNVGEVDETVYSATVVAPFGATVQLIPEKLQFTKSSKTLSYQVVFTSTFTSLKEDIFGSITWSNGKHSVRIPFALTV